MNFLWLKLSRKAINAGAARKAKQAKVAREKEEKAKKNMAKKIVTMVAKELELQAALRDDEAFPMLPHWSNKDLLTSTRGLQKLHDTADIVKDDGKGEIPTMEHVQEMMKAAREVKTHIGGMLEIIRQAKCLRYRDINRMRQPQAGILSGCRCMRCKAW